MSVIHVDQNNFEEVKNKDIVLVDFFATWCGPCKMLGPVLEEISSNNNITVAKIDVDENHDLAKQYGVMSIPTLILFKNGEILKKNVGFMNVDELNEWINNN